MRRKITYLTIFFLTFLCSISQLHAQSFTLQGKVSDEDMNPIELATVAVVKQGKVAMTNLKGEFNMTLSSDDSVVVRFSMVGYKNDRYMWFGKAAAKLDDAANYIPARLSALLLIAASAIAGKDYDAGRAARIWKRDRRNHKSPNAAQTESAAAGALGVQLAGDAYYFGKLYEKKTIGDNIREIETEDIKRANRLMYVTTVLVLGVSVMFSVMIRGLLCC